MRNAIAIFALLLSCTSCTVYGGGNPHQLIGSKHDLAAGTVIKDEDIRIFNWTRSWSLVNGYRLDPIPEEFTTERSRVVGHTVLRDITSNVPISVGDISK
jgi:Flp pilus assembly protein CpaB